MKKTVFVGKVNDQEFNNVNDYNACVQAMLDMGEQFQASSSYQVVEVNEPCECDVCSNTETKPLKAVTSYLPGFDKMESGEYIDEIISDDENEFEKNITNVDNYLQEVYNKIYEALPYNNEDQVKVYGQQVNDILIKLAEDMDKTHQAYDPINKRIYELEAELESLYNSAEILEKSMECIDLYSEFYSDVLDLIYKEPETQCTQCDDCCCECDDKIDKDKYNKFINTLFNIFNDKL